MNILNKIVAKELDCVPKTADLVGCDGNDEQQAACALRLKNSCSFAVTGFMTDCEVVTTTLGDSIRFKGDFLAIRTVDRAEFSSGELFGPGAAEDFLLGMLDGARQADGFQGVEFAILVYPVPAKSATKYKWQVETLVEAAADSRAAKMSRNLTKLLSDKGALPQLLAPAEPESSMELEPIGDASQSEPSEGKAKKGAK